MATLPGVTPNAPRTPHRTIRVSDDLWHAAQDESAKRGETVTDAIRRALEQYTGLSNGAPSSPMEPGAESHTESS